MYEWRLPIPASDPSIGIKDMLVACGLAKSGSEAWRKIDEGAVEVDGEPVRDRTARVRLSPGAPHLVRLGRRWVRVVGDPGASRPTRSDGPVAEPGA